MKTRYILSCLLLGGALSVSAQKTAVKKQPAFRRQRCAECRCGICLRPQIHIRFVRQHTPVETHGRICQQILAHTTGIPLLDLPEIQRQFLGSLSQRSAVQRRRKKMPFGLFPWLKEHRYAGWLAGGGISYGYHIMLNRHWNIEVSVGVGYEYIDYKKYKCPDVCAELLEKGHYHYFGPSKASLSIVYIFN